MVRDSNATPPPATPPPATPPPLAPPGPNAVGVLEYPEGYEATPRQYGRGLRTVVWCLLALFAGVTIVTSAVSLGAYCLTSDGGDGRALQSSPILDR